MIDKDRLEALLDQIHRADRYSGAEAYQPTQQVLKAFDEARIEQQRGEAATELLAGHVRARVQAEMDLEAANMRLEGFQQAQADFWIAQRERDQAVKILGSVRRLHQELDGRCLSDGLPWPCETEKVLHMEVPE